MLWPSDETPEAAMFDVSSGSVRSVLCNKDVLILPAEGVKVAFFSRKNNVQKACIEVFLPKHEHVLVGPVLPLQYYIARAKPLRVDNTVLLSINRPYWATFAAAAGRILEERGLTGLAKQGYTTKSFRSTGATTACASGVDQHIVW